MANGDNDFQRGLDEARSYVEAAFSQSIDPLNAILTDIRIDIESTTGIELSYLRGLFQGIVDYLNLSNDDIISQNYNVIAKIADITDMMPSEVLAWLFAAETDVDYTIEQVEYDISDYIADSTNSVYDPVHTIIDNVTDWVTDVIDTTEEIINNIINPWNYILGLALDKAGDMVRIGIKDAIGSPVSVAERTAAVTQYQTVQPPSADQLLPGEEVDGVDVPDPNNPNRADLIDRAPLVPITGNILYKKGGWTLYSSTDGRGTVYRTGLSDPVVEMWIADDGIHRIQLRGRTPLGAWPDHHIFLPGSRHYEGYYAQFKHLEAECPEGYRSDGWWLDYATVCALNPDTWDTFPCNYMPHKWLVE